MKYYVVLPEVPKSFALPDEQSYVEAAELMERINSALERLREIGEQL